MLVVKFLKNIIYFLITIYTRIEFNVKLLYPLPPLNSYLYIYTNIIYFTYNHKNYLERKESANEDSKKHQEEKVFGISDDIYLGAPIVGYSITSKKSRSGHLHKN